MVKNVRQLGNQRYRETFGRSYEGTEEIQRIIIARQLVERHPV